MESRRLKNIMILILLLLNLFLLLLVASWQYARHQAAQNLVVQTTALLNSSGISIDPALLKAEAYPAVYSYSRSADDERAFIPVPPAALHSVPMVLSPWKLPSLRCRLRITPLSSVPTAPTTTAWLKPIPPAHPIR